MAFISSQHHSFDIALASKYGVEMAILIHHFQHWIRINQLRKRNIRNGRCWSFQTRKDIQANFPYWSYEEVKYLTEKLVEKGILMTANYNKNPIDKTLWYAFVDEKKFGVDAENSRNVYERENSPSIGKIPRGRGKIPQPIPDTNTDTKEHIEKGVQGGEPPNPPDPQPPKYSSSKPAKRKRASEEYVKVEEEVALTPSQQNALKKRSEAENFDLQACYKELSTWKLSKQILGGSNDFKAICDWVIDAVKRKTSSPQGSKVTVSPKENENYARKIHSFFQNRADKHCVSLCYDGIEFIRGNENYIKIKFTDASFKEICNNTLRKMNILIKE
jgi:hypothetical protein